VVVCPPYDVIPPERQRLYYEASRYNAIRLEHPLEEDSAAGGGSGATDKYAGAAATFRRWLDDGALFVEEEPAFYVHDQYYLYGGEEMVRRGLLARVRLEPWGVGVRPHEETFPKAKDDRLKLMRACRANFSPLLSLYSDPEGAIGATLSDVTRGEAAVELEPGVDNALDPGERHLLWAATGAEVHRRIGELFSELPLFMADGHHRYETALAYQRERVASRGAGLELRQARRASTM